MESTMAVFSIEYDWEPTAKDQQDMAYGMARDDTPWEATTPT